MTDKNIKTVNSRFGYDEAIQYVKEEILNVLNNAPLAIRSQTRHLASSGGKNIRAQALLACSIGNDGFTDSNAVEAAAATELLHLATLVHDDIVDNAAMRRGITALHKKFGKKSAVLCGDYLFCIAIQLSSTISTSIKGFEQIIPAYMKKICLGELKQNQNNRNYNLSEKEYIKIIYGKTAALFEACFYAGFVLSGETEEMKSRYIDIGKYIGIIFQLSDDCVDYESSFFKAKKPVLSDYKQGVITLPLIYTLKNKSELRLKVNNGINIKDLKKAVIASGGLIYTHKVINNLYNKTKILIDSLDCNQEKNERLILLLTKAAGEIK
ncbi:MAG: hypothetical protein A2Y15_01730 [Clostridiales bacterium GWF2_36_10]|nr:MAG: hypothetical protein A2Y15_01730 [Clostridiales bacterium GWF2_36_10]